MASFNAPTVVLPQYRRGPAAPSRLRRAFVMLAQIVAAATYGFLAVALPAELVVVLIVPVVVCLLVVLWLMPDRATFPLTAIEANFRVMFVLMILWPVYIAVVLPGLPWLTPTRIEVILVTVLLMYSVATSAALRSHLAIVATQSRLLWVGFLTWQASMLVSLPFSQQIGQSTKILIDRQLSYTESFFLGCLVFARRGSATWAIGCMLVLAVICSIDGFIELRMEHPPWALHIPSFLKVDETFLSTVLGSQARSDDGFYRVRGPFVNSLVFAEFLALCTPFVLHWMLNARSLLLRLSLIAVAGLNLAAILVTHSRLGLVGTMVALATYVPLWAFKAWRANRTSLLGPTLLFGAPLIAFGLLGVVFSSHTLTMSVLGGGAQESSNEGRTQQRQMAIPRVLSHPLGHGLGQGAQVLGFRAPNGMLTVDDNFMETTLDLGVLGVVGYYGMFAMGAWVAGRAYLATSERESQLAGPLASMMVVFLVIRSVLAEEDNHPLVFILLGMVMALRARDLALGGLQLDAFGAERRAGRSLQSA